MSVEANKVAGRRFVEEALDGGSSEALHELFWPGAVRHFPPGDITVDPNQSPPQAPRRWAMKTDIHHLYGEGDFITIHLTHHVTFPEGSQFRTRAGTFDVGGKNVEWNAMVVLEFKDGRISEEWVVRDELQLLMQIGVVSAK